MDTQIRVEGVGQLVRAMQQAAGPGIRKEFGRENKIIGEKVARRAKQLAPYQEKGDPFHIRDSIRPASDARVVKVRAGNARRGRYAPIVHWGSGYRPRTSPQPFISKATHEMRDEIEADYLDAIERVIRTVSDE